MSQEQLLIIGTFVVYFALHSLLASLWIKQRVATCCPGLMPYYRLTYNLLAVILAVPLVYLVWRYPGEILWQWQGTAFYVVNSIALVAFLLLLYSLRLYDMKEFMGLRQAKAKVHQVQDQEHFQLSTFHRYVRHPWYFLILVIIWTRDVTTSGLLIYSLITLYLFIGSRLEERKLIAYHGAVYDAYRRRVAGLFPLPWKILSEDEANRLLERYQNR